MPSRGLLGRYLLGVATVAEAGAGDLGDEVLGHLVLSDVLADPDPDLVRIFQPPRGPPRTARHNTAPGVSGFMLAYIRIADWLASATPGPGPVESMQVDVGQQRGKPRPQRNGQPGRWSPSVSGPVSFWRLARPSPRAGMRCRMVIFSGPMRMSLTSSRRTRWRSVTLASWVRSGSWARKPSRSSASLR